MNPLWKSVAVDIAVICAIAFVLVMLSEYGSDGIVNVVAVPLCLAVYFVGKMIGRWSSP